MPTWSSSRPPAPRPPSRAGTAITDLDIALAAELALPHRLRRGPFHQSEVSLDDLQARIDQAQAQVGAADESEPSTEEQPADKKKVSRAA